MASCLWRCCADEQSPDPSGLAAAGWLAGRRGDQTASATTSAGSSVGGVRLPCIASDGGCSGMPDPFGGAFSRFGSLGLDQVRCPEDALPPLDADCFWSDREISADAADPAGFGDGV